MIVMMELTVWELLCRCREKCLLLGGREEATDAAAEWLTVGVALARSRMLAGGIATVLEFVSTVRVDITVGLVDCIECTSENVLDLTDEEQNDMSGAMLA